MYIGFIELFPRINIKCTFKIYEFIQFSKNVLSGKGVSRFNHITVKIKTFFIDHEK